MPTTPAAMIEAVIRNLPAKTGKTYAQWQAIARRGPKEPQARYAWLRAEHGSAHVAALILAGLLRPYADPAALVDAQYAGTRAPLRPIYDAVLAAARRLGRDVVAKPCKTYVPLHRTKTFALLKPAAGRVEVGLVLPGVAPTARLRAARHLGSDRVTHQVTLTTRADVDAQLKRWLEQAYERA